MKIPFLQVIWEGSDHLGESHSLFTGVLYNHYSAPPGLCFDMRCVDNPIQDDTNLKGYNLDFKVLIFYFWGYDYKVSVIGLRFLLLS